MKKTVKINKQNILYIMTVAILALSLVNTYSVFGLGQQVNALQGAFVLAAVPAGNNVEIKEAEPLGGNAAPTQPQQVTISADDDPFLGPEDAKVTVIEFSDFECPYCAAAMGTHDALIGQFKSRDPSWEAAVPKLRELAAEGKIKFVYRDFPLNSHQNAQKAAEATECANEQGKYWEMHDKIFENQTAIGVANLKQYAADLGLDTAAFNECLDSGAMAEEVQKDFADGQKYGVTGTPAFFINGTKISGAQSFSAFEQIIESELAKGGN